VSTRRPTAYSYIRFSTPEQAQGDSFRRQAEKAAAYCKRRGWKLDESLTLHDLGVSAFRGDNALVGNLRTFLDAIGRGTVVPGSALIVESVDRISRQGIDEGYDLCKRILKAGVLLVTLSPEREFDVSAVKSLTKGALELQLILERAAEESERKSERVREAWGEKRRKAREDKALVTRWLPAWVEERGGERCLIPARAAVLKRIFALAATGYGYKRIAARLNAEKIPAWGTSGEWTTSYIGVILRDRRAVGEYRPRDRKHKPAGGPIAGYFPAAVSEDEWRAAHRAAVARGRMRGRVSEFTNLFTGLLTNARDGEGYFVTLRNDEGGRRRVLINFSCTQGRAKCYAFPLEVFEKAVLSRLREIDPHEILNGDQGPDETQALAGELAHVEGRIERLQAELLGGGEIEALASVVRQLDKRRRDLAARLADARHEAAHPLSECWGEAHGLIDALASAPDATDARLRLRTAMRRVVDSIHLLVVPRGKDRLCAVQITFHGSKKPPRHYAIFHRPPRGNGKARTEGWSVTGSLADVVQLGPLDLRRRDHVARLEAALQRLDLSNL
jgi:DNA invertase Pin-like site-specific DNA recombinase